MLRRDGLSQGDLDGFYKQANAKFSDDEAFAERSRHRVVLLQRGDEETLVLWRRLVDMSAAYFNRVYTKLGVLLTDDDLAGESRYQPLMEGVYERLDEAGLLREDDGAMVVDVDGFTNRDGDPLPLIAEVAYRCLHVRDERSGVRRRSGRAPRRRPHAVRDRQPAGATPPDGVRSLRDGGLARRRRARRSTWGSAACSATTARCCAAVPGESVKLVDLLDEAVDRADAAIAEKNPDLDAATRERRGPNMVGIGAIKYADLSTDRVKDYVFDFDRMLAFEGNTGPYLQYAHARICSIFRRAGRRAGRRCATAPIELVERPGAGARPADPGVPDGDRRGARQVQPHKLCTYVFDLATAFSAFYEHCPDQGSPEPVRIEPARAGRPDRAGARTALGLLGIDAPEQM